MRDIEEERRKSIRQIRVLAIFQILIAVIGFGVLYWRS